MTEVLERDKKAKVQISRKILSPLWKKKGRKGRRGKGRRGKAREGKERERKERTGWGNC